MVARELNEFVSAILLEATRTETPTVRHADRGFGSETVGQPRSTNRPRMAGAG
jgi:hypothetical protein